MTPATHGSRAYAQRARRRNVLIMVAVGVIVVAIVVLVAVITAGGSSDSPSVEELAGSPTIEGDELPPPPEDPTTDPSIGSPAPVVRGAGFDGQAVSVGEAGTPQLLMFVAAWCPACQEELPRVVDWMAAGGVPEGVELTAVVTGLDDSRPNWPPDAWLEAEEFAGAVLVDDADSSVAAAYGLTGTPYWVVLDADGEVVLRFAGLLETPQLDQLAQLATQDASPAPGP